jgi:hypothetical protein
VAAGIRRLILRPARVTAAAGAARTLRGRARNVALPRSGAGRHRSAIHQRKPPSSLALSRSSQPRLPVPLLSSSAVGHRRDRAQYRRHCLELHDHAARVAQVEAARPRTGSVAAPALCNVAGGPQARGLTREAEGGRGKRGKGERTECVRDRTVLLPGRDCLPSVTAAASVRAPCRSSALPLRGHGFRLSTRRTAPYRRTNWLRTFHGRSTV